jgi:Flp pilus assembly protein TadD
MIPISEILEDVAPSMLSIEDGLAHASACIKKGDLPQAQAIAAPLLATHANDSRVQLLWGRVMASQQLYREAKEAFMTAHKLNREDGQALTELALIYRREGQTAVALATLDKAVMTQTGQPLAGYHRAHLYLDRHMLTQAAADFETCLQHSPKYLPALLGLCQTQWQRGKDSEVLSLARRALILHPRSEEALSFASAACLRSGDSVKAEQIFVQGTQLLGSNALVSVLSRTIGLLGSEGPVIARWVPDAPVEGIAPALALQLGRQLLALGCPAEALKWLQSCATQSPAEAGTSLLLAFALHMTGDSKASRNILESLAQTDGNSAAQLMQAQQELQHGKWSSGWKNLAECAEKALNPRSAFAPVLAKLKPWRGGKIKGLRLLVIGDGSFAFNILYARFVCHLADQGAQIVFAVDPEALALFEQLHSQVQVVPRQSADPGDAQVWCLLAQLPSLLGLSAPPTSAPYLRPAPHLVEKIVALWNQTAETSAQTLNIGVGWDRRPGNALQALWGLGPAEPSKAAREPRKKIIWHSFGPADDSQTLLCVEQHIWLHSQAPLLDQIPALSAAVSKLDLLITTDTPLAHMAAAIGIPVWVVMGHLPEFSELRTVPAGSQSPWYENMTLYQLEASDTSHEKLRAKLNADLTKWRTRQG